MMNPYPFWLLKNLTFPLRLPGKAASVAAMLAFKCACILSDTIDSGVASSDGMVGWSEASWGGYSASCLICLISEAAGSLNVLDLYTVSDMALIEVGVVQLLMDTKVDGVNTALGNKADNNK